MTMMSVEQKILAAVARVDLFVATHVPFVYFTGVVVVFLICTMAMIAMSNRRFK